MSLAVCEWQQRCFVSVTATEAIPDETLWTFAKEIAKHLPSGGEPPTIVKRLPAEGFVEGSALFFHEEISIQMEIWLGGENLLALSHTTNGIVARYAWGEQKARLLLIGYPTASEAAQGLKARRGSEIKDIVASESNSVVLTAMIGNVDVDKAQALLKKPCHDRGRDPRLELRYQRQRGSTLLISFPAPVGR